MKNFKSTLLVLALVMIALVATSCDMGIDATPAVITQIKAARDLAAGLYSTVDKDALPAGVTLSGDKMTFTDYAATIGTVSFTDANGTITISAAGEKIDLSYTVNGLEVQLLFEVEYVSNGAKFKKVVFNGTTYSPASVAQGW